MNTAFLLDFWLIVQIFGLLALPISFTLFKNLPDRGYAFSKALGLLLSGYVLWLAGSLGLLRNNLGGTLLAMAAVTLFGWLWYRYRQRDTISGWLREQWRYVLTVEVLYLLAFVGWSFFKAYNPDIMTAGGEKWMEIAFINSTLLSPQFPPQDPWLSGFGISYYYFGYILMAMLIRLSGIVSTTAFNLLAPVLLGLTLCAAFGVVSNLTTLQRGKTRPDLIAGLSGLCGALFVGVLGHWHGVLEVLHSRGLLPAGFWTWLDIRDLKIPPDSDGGWIPTRFHWWWRGSRVLTDYNLAGQEQEVIDEMPFFSFLLADIHPHVLALPFVLLVVGLALNMLYSRRPDNFAVPEKLGWASLQQSVLDLVAATGGRIAFGLTVLLVGALGFLNTWDLPVYLAVMGLAYWLWRQHARPVEPVFAMTVFAGLGFLAYLPFYLTFQSQAGGILPNLWNPTRLPQFIVFFGPFLVISLTWLVVLARNFGGWRPHLRFMLGLTLGLPVLLLLVLTAAFLILPGGREFIDGILRDPAVQQALNGAAIGDLLLEILRRRLTNPWTFLFLGGTLGLIAAMWWAWLPKPTPAEGEAAPGLTERFVLSLFIVAFLLPLGLEFIFLRDLFNIRMNSVFKFYFQTWVLLALVAAFAVFYVRQFLSMTGRLVWAAVLSLVILAAMVYPVLATLNKTNNFSGEPTLNGIAWVERFAPDDYAAIQWLRENAPPDAVVLEAPGNSYQYDNRISALTGRATLLGWRFHQRQWRGNYDEPNRREPDIEAIYNETDFARTLTLFDKYDITYVYVGALERQNYRPAGLAKFDQLLNVAFSQGNVVIYERPSRRVN